MKKDIPNLFSASMTSIGCSIGRPDLDIGGIFSYFAVTSLVASRAVGLALIMVPFSEVKMRAFQDLTWLVMQNILD